MDEQLVIDRIIPNGRLRCSDGDGDSPLFEKQNDVYSRAMLEMISLIVEARSCSLLSTREWLFLEDVDTVLFKWTSFHTYKYHTDRPHDGKDSSPSFC